MEQLLGWVSYIGLSLSNSDKLSNLQEVTQLAEWTFVLL